MGAVVILFAGINNLAHITRDLNRRTSIQQSYQAALNSVLNYVRSALKMRWCFRPDFDQDSPAQCHLAHPRSTERLLVTTDQMAYFDAMKAIDPSMPLGNPIRLDRIHGVLKVSDLPDAHPLKPMFSTVELTAIESIEIDIQRDETANSEAAGTETHLRVSVTFKPADGQAFADGRTILKATDQLAVYPRELSIFGLIVPGDLILDGSGAQAGDVSIPNVQGRGLVFSSPVFVNRNLRLPEGPLRGVHFGDQIVMGRGIVFQGGRPAGTTLKGSVEDRTYAALGLQRGIKIDGELDMGLEVFSGRSPSEQLDTQNFQSCLKVNAARFELEATKDATLLVKSLSEGQFRLAWSHMDYFEPQNVKASASASGNFLKQPKLDAKGNDKPIVRVLVKYDIGPTVTAYMARGNTLTISQPNISFGKGNQGQGNQGQGNQGQGNQGQGNQGQGQGNQGQGNQGDDEAKEAEKQFKENAGELIIQLKEVVENGNAQSNQADLEIELKNRDFFASAVTVEVMGYDIGYMNASQLRAAPVTLGKFANVATLRYGITMGKFFGSVSLELSYPNTFTRADRANPGPEDLEVNTDWEGLSQKCDADETDQGYAFQPVNWSGAFTGSTRFSWSVREPAALPTGFLLDQNNARSQGAVKPQFHVRSIEPRCTVQSSANFVAGFFVCDQFIIQPRTQPLRITGTVIAKQMFIDASAIRAGIRWSNIYDPAAVLDLRQAGILASRFSANAPSCNPTFDNPLWHPVATIAMRDDRYSCNSVSLRDQFDNIRWTTVDPDCGLISGAYTTTCKRRANRYVIKELERYYE